MSLSRYSGRVQWIYVVGEKVLTTTDPAKGWDGKQKGVSLDGNIYVWTCKYQFAGEPVRFSKGTVVIIK